MKLHLKLLSVALLVAVSTITHAQTLKSSVALKTPRTAVINPLIDTAVNTGTAKLGVVVPGYQSTVALQVKLTNISGTTGGVIRLFGTVDGINYVRIPSWTSSGTVVVDSLIADVNHLSKIFVVHNHDYQAYQIQYTGASTMSVAISGAAIWRRQ